MTVQPITKRKNVEVTVAYLADLLLNAGFIDAKQRADLDNVDRQYRAQAKGKVRGEDDASPFKAVSAMNLQDASGQGTRVEITCWSVSSPKKQRCSLQDRSPKLDIDSSRRKSREPLTKAPHGPIQGRDGPGGASRIPFDLIH